jgi:hypothetical protein
MTQLMPETNPSCESAVAQVVHFFETLSPASVALIAKHYAANARFKDPFNEVQGTEAIELIFTHMFRTLNAPRFKVTQQIVQGRHCFLSWEFHFSFQRFHPHTPQMIVGASHLVFSERDQIVIHRDYWDAAEELYEKLPVLGTLLRWVKRQAKAA